MSAQEFEFCDCIGPMYGEPYCICIMKRHGLPMSIEHKEVIAKAEAKLTELFGPRAVTADKAEPSK